MLKRLSYPLAWMEGLTSEKDEKEVLSSVPNSADSQHHSSVFSKVFSRQVMRLVQWCGFEDLLCSLNMTFQPSCFSVSYQLQSTMLCIILHVT